MIVYVLLAVAEIYQLLVPPGFDIIIFLRIFLHDKFHVRVRQRKPKLILHTILYIWPHINFRNKGMSFFRNVVYELTHNNPFGSGLKDVNEVGRSIVCILDDIIVLLNQRQYNIYCV